MVLNWPVYAQGRVCSRYKKNLNKGIEAIPSSSLDKKNVGWKTENYTVRRFIIRRSSGGSVRAIKSVRMV